MSHDQSTSNPYRKVSVATWTDRKVMNLSPLQPSGQALFLMLMVGPQTTNIPGIQPVGRMAFAEMLGWALEAFDRAFEEASREGFVKADWKARLIYVPNAIKHNLPQSPNVVKSWASMWSRVPDCELKEQAWESLHAALERLGKAFSEAFKSACPLKKTTTAEGKSNEAGKPSEKPSDKATDRPTDGATDNQEAVNSKQETGNTTPPTPRGGGGRRTDPDEEPDGFAAFYDLYRRKDAKRAAIKAWRQLNPTPELQAKILAALQRWRWSDDRSKIPLPASWLNGRRWEDEAVSRPAASEKSDGALPQWCIDAGFEHIAQAQNARCHIGNFREFRDGKRIPAEEMHA